MPEAYAVRGDAYEFATTLAPVRRMASSCDGVDPAPFWVPSGSQRSLGALGREDIVYSLSRRRGTVTRSHGPALPP